MWSARSSPKLDWKKVHDATGAIAKRIEATAPEVFTTTQGPDNRKGRIFIDFHRNARAATAVAPVFVAGAQHSAGIGAADVGNAREPSTRPAI